MTTQWMWTAEQLRSTPSSFDGITLEKERFDRNKGCSFIMSVGISLKLPQLTMSTAAVFLHRFYMRYSLKQVHYYDIGATALLLATKVEETSRKLRDIVIACARIAQKNRDLVMDEQSKEFWRWRDTMLYNEELLLEALCFDLTIQHPYTPLLQYCKQFGPSSKEDNPQGKNLARSAWAFVNDSVRTMLCVMYPPATIAAAALWFASKHHEIPLSDRGGQPWWGFIGVDLHDLSDATSILADLYDQLPQNPGVHAYHVSGTEAPRKEEDAPAPQTSNEAPPKPAPVNGNEKEEGEL